MEAKSSPFDVIPLEVFENIFKRMQLNFFASICLVCKQWNEVFADQSGIWRLMFNTRSVKCNTDYNQHWRPIVVKLAKILSSFKIDKTFEYAYMTGNHFPDPKHSFHLLSDCFIIADGSLMTIIDLTNATTKPLKKPVSFFSTAAIDEYVFNDHMNEQLAAQPEIITEYPFQPVMFYGHLTNMFGTQKCVRNDGKQQLFIIDNDSCVVWDREEFKRGLKSYKHLSGFTAQQDRNCLSFNSKYMCTLEYYNNEGELSIAKLTEKCCPRARVSTIAAATSPPRCTKCHDHRQPVDNVEADLGPIQRIYALNNRPDGLLFFFADKLGMWGMVAEGSLEIFNYLFGGLNLSFVKFDEPQDFSNIRNISDHTTDINGVKRFLLGFTCRENTTVIMDLKDSKYRVKIETTQFKWVPNQNKVAVVKSDSIEIYDLDRKTWQISIKTLDGFVDLAFDPSGKILFLATKEQQLQIYHWETGVLIATVDDLTDLKHVFCFNDVLVVISQVKAKIFKLLRMYHSIGSLTISELIKMVADSV